MRGAGNSSLGDLVPFGIDWTLWLEQLWEGDSTVTLGVTVRPITPNGFEYVCVAPGQTGILEPYWPAFAGALLQDGSVEWQAQPCSNASLFTTLTAVTWQSAPPIVATSPTVYEQIASAFIDSRAGVQGIDYVLFCNSTFADGSTKTAKVTVKVR